MSEKSSESLRKSKLSTIGVVALIFSFVAAGAFGIEEAIAASGPGLTLIMLLVFKVIQGIGHALNSTTSNAVEAEVLHRDKVGQGIGYYSLHSLLSNAIGPTPALALMGVGAAAVSGGQNYLLPMLVGGGMGVAALLIGLSMNYEKKLKAQNPGAFRRPQGIHVTDFVDRRALLPAVMILILGMLASYLFFVEGYRNAVEINPDRRLYALLTGELIFYILIVVIVFFLLVSVISSLPLMSVGNYFDNNSDYLQKARKYGHFTGYKN